MRFYKLEPEKLWIQRAHALPSTVVDDEGRVIYNYATESVYFRNSEGWEEITTSIPNTITRGLFAGGTSGAGNLNTIEYMNIASLGSSGYDFGDLTSYGRTFMAGTSDGPNQRGLIMGGQVTNIIEYVTININSNAVDFGDLVQPRSAHGACSNNTNERGLCMGGTITVGFSATNIVDYITINSAGNALDQGDLTQPKIYTASCSNGANDRAVCWQSSGINIIDYMTISSTGNAIDFGDITSPLRYSMAATSNLANERGVMAGGFTTIDYNFIDYITINSTGNSSDFGDLTEAKYELAGLSNGTLERGIFGGGTIHPSGDQLNTIEYVTINTVGDSSDFGSILTTYRSNTPATCSG